MTKYIDQFIAEYDTNGEPLVGGKLNFYEAGTTTPTPVYEDEALVTPLSNPVVADGDGRFQTMYMQSISYKIVLTDSNNVVIKTIDNADYTGAVLFDDIKQQATTSYSGVSELATPDEVLIGTDNERTVTPFAIATALETLVISPAGYILGGVVSNDGVTPDSLIDISECKARDEDNEQDLSVLAGSLDLLSTGSWADGVVPSLSDATIYVWADYNGGSSRFIFDNLTGSNIGGAKRRVDSFITDVAGDIIPFVKTEKAGGSILTTYDEPILDSSVGTTSALISTSVPKDIPITGNYIARTGGGDDNQSNSLNIRSTEDSLNATTQITVAGYHTMIRDIIADSEGRIYLQTAINQGSTTVYINNYLDERI